MNAAQIKQMASEIAAMRAARAKQMAAAVFGDVPYGAEQLSKAQFLDMLRRNWQDPNYRKALGGYYDQQGMYHAGRISAEAFLTAAQEAGLIPPWDGAVKQLEAGNGTNP